MPRKDIIVIGASLGGIEALKKLASTLPKTLRASIFIVLHLAPSSPGILPLILERSGPLTASNAKDGDTIRHGHFFVAPPDRHLLVDPEGYLRVTNGPKENWWRPAIDPLFRSAACAFGGRVVGVILTGSLDDGAAGLWAIKKMGGTAVVQHPDDAAAPAMPLNALARTSVDHCVNLEEIGPLLSTLADQIANEHEVPSEWIEHLQTEVKIASGKGTNMESTKLGPPSPFACPECHGVLSEIREEGQFRFRCHTGHAFSPQTLLAQLMTGTEDSIWNAIRSIEERTMLLRKVAEELESKNRRVSGNYTQEADELQRQASILQKLVLSTK